MSTVTIRKTICDLCQKELMDNNYDRVRISLEAYDEPTGPLDFCDSSCFALWANAFNRRHIEIRAKRAA